MEVPHQEAAVLAGDRHPHIGQIQDGAVAGQGLFLRQGGPPPAPLAVGKAQLFHPGVDVHKPQHRQDGVAASLLLSKLGLDVDPVLPCPPLPAGELQGLVFKLGHRVQVEAFLDLLLLLHILAIGFLHPPEAHLDGDFAHLFQLPGQGELVPLKLVQVFIGGGGVGEVLKGVYRRFQGPPSSRHRP